MCVRRPVDAAPSVSRSLAHPQTTPHAHPNPPPHTHTQVLQRGEKLDILVDKTEHLSLEVGGTLMRCAACCVLRAALRAVLHCVLRCVRHEKKRHAHPLTPKHPGGRACKQNTTPLRQADRFQKTGRQLRNKMWWSSMRMKLLVGASVVLLILIIFLCACFAGGRNCTKKGGGGGDGGR